LELSKRLVSGGVNCEDHAGFTMADADCLCAEEPERDSGIVDGNLELRQRSAVGWNELEARVDSDRGRGHFCAGGEERRLSDGVVLPLELEGDGVSVDSLDARWGKGKLTAGADLDHMVGSLGHGSSECSNNDGGTHVERQ